MVQSVSHENFTSVIKFKLSLVSDEGYKSSPRSMEVYVILSKLKIIISLLKQRVSRIFYVLVHAVLAYPAALKALDANCSSLHVPAHNNNTRT